MRFSSSPPRFLLGGAADATVGDPVDIFIVEEEFMLGSSFIRPPRGCGLRRGPTCNTSPVSLPSKPIRELPNVLAEVETVVLLVVGAETEVATRLRGGDVIAEVAMVALTVAGAVMGGTARFTAEREGTTRLRGDDVMATVALSVAWTVT
jgi:hypothetical protein